MKQKGGIGEKVHDRGPKEKEEGETYASFEKALSHLRDLGLYTTALDDFLTKYLTTIETFKNEDIQTARTVWINMWSEEKKTYKNNPLFSDEIMTEIYDLVTDNINNYNTVEEIRESLMTPDEKPSSSPAI